MSRSAIQRVRQVEREYNAATFALARTVEQIRGGVPMVGGQNLAIQDLRRASANAEVTYLIRMMAEFEAMLREYWSMIKRTEPTLQKLIDGVAARQKVADDLLSDVQSIRAYRNAVVHEGEKAPRIPFSESRSRLCRFLAYLPQGAG